MNEKPESGFILPVLAMFLCLLAPIAYLFITLNKASLFTAFLNASPLLWWPKPHLAASVILVILGFASFYFFSKSEVSPKVMIAVASVVAVLFVWATAAAVTAGVAVFPDRIFIREYKGLLPTDSTYWLRDVTRVELECDQLTRRVHRGADRRMEDTAEYRLVFKDGREINLTNAIARREDYKAVLASMTRINKLMQSQGTPRQLSDAQTVSRYETCLLLFRSDLNAYLDEYLTLFSPVAP
ncbi:MAG: hypothetical protein QM645_12090 [Asticcacaulis sp.]